MRRVRTYFEMDGVGGLRVARDVNGTRILSMPLWLWQRLGLTKGRR